MSLFQNIVTKKQIIASAVKIGEAYKIYADYFHNPTVQENIRNSKEEQFQEGFLRELFVKIFGYTLNPTPNYNLITEQKNETNARKADGAILVKGEVIGVIELKDGKTTDLKSIETQAFGYKNYHKKAVYVITSNFEKLRFYIDNAIDYEEFNLFELTEENFAVLWLCLAYENISKNLPTQLKTESVSKEAHITKELYKDYSAFKRALFDDIRRNNPQFGALELFKKTQKLLDRLLFILFAEDIGLLPPNSIMEIVKQWEKLKELDEYRPLYDRLKKYFGYMNTGYKGVKHDIFAYNGGFFKSDEVLDNIVVSDDVLFAHLRKVSDYDFQSEVDVNILGHIFENSLTEIEEVTNEITTGEKQTSKRKKDGVFYTPRYITAYIVENTVGKLCADKKTELEIDEAEYFSDKKRQKETKKKLDDKLTAYRQWLLSLTICDPACGSGAFLNAALDFLIAEHKLIDEMSAKLMGVSIVFSEIENAILENNLYGVDINEESIEIARLSLWLRTAKPNRKLNSLNDNIKCGNSLISDPETAGEKAFDWHKEFPQVFENGGFDVIVGNPPYVHLENIREESEKLSKQNYQTYDKRGDLYALFVEKGFSVLKESGYISYIMPNKWLQAGYGKSLRGYFLSKKLVRLIDFGDMQIFEGATTYPCIFISQNEDSNIVKLGKSMTAFQNKVDKMFEPTRKLQKALEPINKLQEFGKSMTALQDKILEPTRKLQEALEPMKKLQELTKPFKVSVLSSFLNTDFYSAVEQTEEEFDADKLTDDTWVISSQQDSQLLERLKNENITLEKFINGQSYRGVLTGLTEAFLIDEETKKQLIDEDNKAVEIIKPVIRGRDILPWSNGAIESYLIGTFPSLNIDIENYISIKNHLLSFGKDRLEQSGNKGSRKKTNNKWFETQDAIGYYQEFAKPKIMYQKFQVKPCFIFDKSGLYCNDSMWIIPTESKALLAILNSKMGWWLISKYCTQIQNGYQLIWKYFGQIPIPKMLTAELEILANKMLSHNSDLQTKRQRFLKHLSDNFAGIKIASKIEVFDELDFAQFVAELKKQKIALTLKQQDEWEEYFLDYKMECNSLSVQISEMDKEIDRMVYTLYGLSEEEIGIIEK